MPSLKKHYSHRSGGIYDCSGKMRVKYFVKYLIAFDLILYLAYLNQVRFKVIMWGRPLNTITTAWFFLPSIFVRWIWDFVCNRRQHVYELYFDFLFRNKLQKEIFLRASNNIQTFFGGFQQTTSKSRYLSIKSPRSKTRCSLLGFHKTDCPRANPTWQHRKFE